MTIGASGYPGRVLNWARDPQALSTLFALAVVTMTLLVLVGWSIQSDVLIRVRPQYAAMVPSTALCLLCLSAALLLGQARPRLAQGLAGLVGCIALFELVYLTLFRIWGEEFSSPLMNGDGMAFGTSLSLVLLVLCVFETTRLRVVPAWLGTSAATLGGFIALIAINAYLFDAEALYEGFAFTAMSILTAICLLFLGLAYLFQTSERNWMGVLTGTGRGSASARRSIPLVFAFPILIGLTAISATEQGWINANTRLSVMAVLLSSLSVAWAIRSAQLDNAAESSQRRNERRLNELVDQLGDAVIGLDDRGRVLFVNEKASELMSALAVADAQDFLDNPRFINTETMEPVESPSILRPWERQQRNAQIVALSDRGHALRYLRITNGHLSGDAADNQYFLSIEDVTEAYTLRLSTERSERLEILGEIAGGITHDLSNIMGVVRLSADVGLRSTDIAETRKQFDTIRAACERSEDLVSRVLDFSRDKGAAEIIDTSGTLRNVLRLAQASTPSSILIEDHIASNLPAIRVDAGLFESAVLNLVVNARDAIGRTSRFGKIRVSAMVEDGEIVLDVLDDGPGMTSEILQRAEEPFFTTRANLGGTGLGLQTVRRCMHSANGTFHLTSTPGEGTLARLCLPIPKDAEVRSEAGVAVDTAMFSGRTILCVEDDPIYSEALGVFLKSRGAEVAMSGAGANALGRLADGFSCSLLITDFQLPGDMNGPEIILAARKLRPDLPCIILSGLPDDVPALPDVPVISKAAPSAKLVEEITRMLG